MSAPAEPGTRTVRVRYFAGARAAAGVDEEIIRVTRQGDGLVTAAEVIEAISSLHDGHLAGVIPSCSYLLNGVAVRDRSAEVSDGSEFDVLPPFAGG